MRPCERLIFHLFGLGGGALGADEVLVQAGVVAADVAQRPGDVGIDRLPVGVAVELRHAADLLVEQRGDGGVEHGVVGDDLPGRVLAGVRPDRRSPCPWPRAGRRTLRSARRCRLPTAAPSSSAPDRSLRITFILSRAPSVFLRYLSLSSARMLRIDGSRPVEDVGGKAALGVQVARDVADRPHQLAAGSARPRPCPWSGIS